MKTAFISLTFILLTINIVGQSKVHRNFTKVPPPTPGSKNWSFLNWSRNEFGVKTINGKLNIRKVKEVHRVEYKIDGGKLVGVDNGEFGGELTYEYTDSARKKIHIMYGNIKDIFLFEGKILVIEGIAHGGVSEGALYELNLRNNFSYKRVLAFEDAPRAYTIYNDKILIASYEGFFVIKDFRKEMMLKETFWAGLYPNSVAVIDDKNIFIGMRGGIVKLDLTTKAIEFYKYTK